jgi:hypothetical protein
MQKRSPDGCGPSPKTCPKCAPHRAHDASVRTAPRFLSSDSRTFKSETGAQKLGHPVPDSNLSRAQNKSAPQQTHA